MTVASIANNFRTSASFATDGEVALFRKLAIAITNSSNSVFVDETHGATTHNVAFNLTTGVSTRCEIADLLIITKSKNHPFLRATFWQAKKQSNPKWISLGTSDKHIDFKGKFNQWDLLSRRPPIQGIAPFHPPSDLLSSFDSASIGSFGVFYQRNSKIEVMHSVAEFIACGSPRSAKPTLVANAFLERYSYMGEEVAVRVALEPFLGALFEHQIGAPVLMTEPSHQWLVSYAATKVAVSGQEIPDNFFIDFDYSRPLDVSGKSDGVSVLLVDTDVRYNKSQERTG